MTAPVLKSLTQAAVIELAGPAAYERGLYYRHDGRVETQALERGRVFGALSGHDALHGAAAGGSGSAGWSCSCPVGDSAEFCKHSEAVVTLVEHAHRLADDALQYVDDSDGWLSDISERTADLHLKACEGARLHPV